MLIAALTRDDIGNYVSALFEVYILIIIVYVLLNMMFSLGLRTPFSRWSDAVLGFLRDVSEPYLRVFRRLIPPLGGIDFTPMLAIIVLYLVRSILVRVIQG
jgi:YggT family protein